MKIPSTYRFEKLYINGEWKRSSGNLSSTVINPASEHVFAHYVQGGVTDVNFAVEAAHKAFWAWAKTNCEERSAYIVKLAEIMRERREELAVAISSELGMPLHLCREIQVDGPIAGLLSYANYTKEMDKIEQQGNAYIVKDPIGVCGFINPWNYPLHQMIGKVAPALAAGCTMVVKPSEQTPIHAFLLAEMIEQAGFPAGVFNLVTGPGRVIGEALCTHPLVDMISFTGSTGAGTRVAQLAAESVKRVCLELGGKSPFIISGDAQLAEAVEHGVRDIMMNSGQTCTALSRMFIPEDQYLEAVKIAKDIAESLQVGDPSKQETDMGPMCSEAQRDTVLRYINVGIEEGATLVTGGIEISERCEQGFYVYPTIFADVDNSMRIAKEEIFGPVLCMIPYSHLDEAVAMANDSEFGLSAAVWSGTNQQALDIASRLQAGQVFVNGADFNYTAPFGGYKRSGNGREWGVHGLQEFFETKAIMQ